MPYSAIAIALGFAGSAMPDHPIVLMDQIGWLYEPDVTTGFVASQRFDPDHAAYDVAAIENFSVEAVPVTVCEVAAAMRSDGPGFLEQTSYSVEIYSSPAAAARDLAGDVASVSFDAPDAVLEHGSDATLVFSVDVFLDAEAEYWIAVVSRRDWKVGQVTVGRTLRGDDESYLASPSGVWGFTLMSIAELIAPREDTGVAYRVLAGACPPICKPAPRGDVNDDGWTDFTDLVTVLANWTPAELGGCGVFCPDLGDANCDGAIDGTDLMFVIEFWDPAP